jgi:hypothetical protein
MLSKPLAVVVFVLGCLTAAAGGSYLALRHNVSDRTPARTVSEPVTSVAAAQPAGPQPVAETEAAVTAPKTEPLALKTGEAEAPMATTARPAAAAKSTPKSTSKPSPASSPAPSRAPQRTTPAAGAGTPAVNDPSATPAPVQSAPVAPLPAAAEPSKQPAKPVEEPRPEPPRQPQFDELIIPASSVIGLQVETPTTTERARVEDRIDARVSRDVMAGGRVAIPAGSRVMGSVVTVERGGKVKEQARLGIRFHTLVLADGTQVQLHTDTLYRLGEAPSAASSKKIGGAAIGGAILGAILGGGKGAAIGGATGAAGGTAAVMAGDRNPATLRQGEYLNVKLASPATITVERRE